MSRRIKSSVTRNRLRARGVSLIEALLALVVMSLGMLAVVGVQATLRGNGDLSRQRAEAVRLAQESIETLRTFTSVTSVPGQVDYTDIVSDPPLGQDISPPGSNTTYKRIITVPPGPPNGSPPFRTLGVEVKWLDRVGVEQQVQLFTTVARIAPAIAASLSVPPNGAPARQPLGRHTAIPRGAIPGTNGTSTFAPPLTPGLPATTLVFNNLTGLITCITEAPDPACVAFQGQLVTGYVGVPSASTVFNVRVDYASEGTAGNAIIGQDPMRASDLDRTEQCFVADPALIGTEYVSEYFCVVRLNANDPIPKAWKGQLVFGPGTAFLPPNAVVPTPTTLMRACRYTPVAATYASVTKPLSHQNFLLVNAADLCTAGTDPHQPP